MQLIVNCGLEEYIIIAEATQSVMEDHEIDDYLSKGIRPAKSTRVISIAYSSPSRKYALIAECNYEDRSVGDWTLVPDDGLMPVGNTLFNDLWNKATYRSN